MLEPAAFHLPIYIEPLRHLSSLLDMIDNMFVPFCPKALPLKTDEFKFEVCYSFIVSLADG